MHTYHTISHTDKITHTLALLKADSHKIFKSHRIFRPSKKTFYKEIIINHTFWGILGEFQRVFCENLKEFYQTSLKILVYLTDFSPQFMA